MRYKELATRKIDQLQNQLRTLEFSITRAESLDQVKDIMNQMKDELEHLQSLINIEPDEMKMDQII